MLSHKVTTYTYKRSVGKCNIYRDIYCEFRSEQHPLPLTLKIMLFSNILLSFLRIYKAWHPVYDVPNLQKLLGILPVITFKYTRETIK